MSQKLKKKKKFIVNFQFYRIKLKALTSFFVVQPLLQIKLSF